jgi:hypothetical protein
MQRRSKKTPPQGPSCRAPRMRRRIRRGWDQAPSRPLDETRRRSDISRRQRRRGDHDRTRASHRTRFGSCRTTRCACPSPRPVRRRPSAAFLLGGTTGTVRRLCLGWRAWRRPRVQRTMNQLRRMRRRCLVLRECRSRRGRRTAARLRCGGLPGGRVGLGQRHSVGFLGRSCDREDEVCENGAGAGSRLYISGA